MPLEECLPGVSRNHFSMHSPCSMLILTRRERGGGKSKKRRRSVRSSSLSNSSYGRTDLQWQQWWQRSRRCCPLPSWTRGGGLTWGWRCYWCTYQSEGTRLSPWGISNLRQTKKWKRPRKGRGRRQRRRRQKIPIVPHRHPPISGADV